MCSLKILYYTRLQSTNTSLLRGRILGRLELLNALVQRRDDLRLLDAEASRRRDVHRAIRANRRVLATQAPHRQPQG